MSFHLGRFIKHATVVTLKEYVHHRTRNWPEDFDWEQGQRKLVGAFENVCASFTESQNARIRRELHQIEILSDEVGQNVVLRLAEGDRELSKAVQSARNQWARALELLLHDQQLFERAIDLAAVERCRFGRSWSGFQLTRIIHEGRETGLLGRAYCWRP